MTGPSCASYALCASTGWLNLLGQVALTASVDSSLANHISAMWVIYNGHVFSQEELLLCYAGEAPCRTCCLLRVHLALKRKTSRAGQQTQHHRGLLLHGSVV